MQLTKLKLSVSRMRLLLIWFLAVDVVTGFPRYLLGIQNPAYLFIIVVIFSSIGLFRKNAFLGIGRDELFLLPITLLFFGIGLWAALVGILAGNDPHQVINDGATFLIYPAYLMIWMGVFPPDRSAHESLDALLKLFIGISSMACITYLLVLMSFPGKFSDTLMDMVDNAHVNVFGDYVQIFFLSLSFLVPLSYALIVRFSTAKDAFWLRLAYFILFITVFLLILISYVRAYWLMFALGLAFLLFGLGKRSWLFIPAISFILILILGFSLGIHDAGNIIMHRIESTLDPLQSSNETKLMQIPYLWDAALDNPILGKGFGMHLRFLRSPAQPYTYEVDMMAMVAKFGICAFLLFCGAFVWIMYSFYGLFNKFKKLNLKFEAGMALFGFISIFYWLVIDWTNPYMNSPLGMFYIYFFLAILSLLRKRHKELKGGYG